jgi:ribosome biogenesis GTPase
MYNHQEETLLQTYGWQSCHAQSFVPYENLGYQAYRIVREGKGLFWGFDGEHELLLKRSGSFQNLEDLGVQPSPVIGDWCAVLPYGDEQGLIEGVLERTTAFHKPSAGDRERVDVSSSVVAANIDKAAIVQDIRNDFNLRKTERFLSLLHADGIPSLLILTKCDLVEEADLYPRRVHARFPDLQVFLVDNLSGKGATELAASLGKRTTLMVLGSSGAGKSTLLNCLSGKSVAKTQEVRSSDGRGRHTTTSRQLHLLPNGALLLDTPGLRSVGMNSSSLDVEDSFADIALLASQCRFSDCSHTGEPGCAVKQALLAGELEQDRYLNYLKLRSEAQSWEEVLNMRKQKDKHLGKLLYHYRREGLYER